MSRRTMGMGLVTIVLATAVQLNAAGQVEAPDAGAVPTVRVDADVDERMGRSGTADVIVGLRADAVPEGTLTPAAAAAQRQRIAVAQRAVESSFAGTRSRATERLTFIPFMAATVDAAGLDRLRRSGSVQTIEPDSADKPDLYDTAMLLNFDSTNGAGIRGTGSTVAVLDSGVDRYHAFLRDSYAEEACFSGGNTTDGSGDCPNGLNRQTGPGSATPCDYDADGCSHGTHVAGIVAGRGGIISGVAQGARIMPIQVFSRSTDCDESDGEPIPDECARTRRSDQLKALEYVYERRNVHRIVAVNMSLGSETIYSSWQDCDAAESSRKDAIDTLRSVGIATIASSGNDSESDGMHAPACISTAVSVGSTNKDDMVAPTSNSSDSLDLLAPGQSIRSSVPGGTFDVKSGTSMAAPHVAGAWAVMKSVAPEAGIERILYNLKVTGRSVLDTRNDITKRRIDVWKAVDHLGTMRIEDTTAREGTDDVAAFRVTLARRYSTTVSAYYRTVAGTATGSSDYVGRSGRIDFQPGETSKVVAVSIIDDTYREGAETFSVELYSSSGARRNRTMGQATIFANDSIMPTPPPYEGPGEMQAR